MYLDGECSDTVLIFLTEFKHNCFENLIKLLSSSTRIFDSNTNFIAINTVLNVS